MRSFARLWLKEATLNSENSNLVTRPISPETWVATWIILVAYQATDLAVTAARGARGSHDLEAPNPGQPRPRRSRHPHRSHGQDGTIRRRCRVRSNPSDGCWDARRCPRSDEQPPTRTRARIHHRSPQEHLWGPHELRGDQ